MFTRFPRFGRSSTVFTSSRPCNHRFLSVLADLHRYVRDRGARVTLSRFPPFWPFPPVSVVWPAFSRHLGRATTVFPALRPISTVTYVTGMPGERLSRFRTYRPFGHCFRRFWLFQPPFSNVSALRMPFSQCLGPMPVFPPFGAFSHALSVRPPFFQVFGQFQP